MFENVTTCFSDQRLDIRVQSLCISEWGSDFRPEYLQLNLFKDSVAKWVKQGLPPVPIIALTATATKPVQAEILRALKLDENNTKVGRLPLTS